MSNGMVSETMGMLYTLTSKMLMVHILHPFLKSVAEHDGIVLVASNDNNHRKTPVGKINQHNTSLQTKLIIH